MNQSGWDAVTIGSVEAWLGDQAWEKGWVEPIRPAAERGETVGIVGAGPAGLAAADRLRCEGYQVTIYDRHDRAGGLLIYGIPGFKLEKHVVRRRADLLTQAGGGAALRNLRATLARCDLDVATLVSTPLASGLSVRTDVSHVRLAVHLTTALVILAGIVWTARDLAALARSPLARPARLRPAARAAS